MRLTLDARGRAILRRLPVTNVYSIAEIVLLALLAWQAARFAWAIVTPVSPLGEWRVPEPAPADTAILGRFDPFFRGEAAAPGTVTSLAVTLFGTRVDEASGRGSAIVAGPDGVQKSVSVGEEVAPGVRLSAVAFDHVTLDRGGQAEDLFLDQSGAGSRVVPAPAPAAGGQVAGPPPAATATAQQIRSDIAVIPRIEGGRVSGLVVRPQGSGAAFRSAGLQPGDVITAFSGKPVTGADDIARVAAEFAKGGRIPITVERGGDTVPLSIAVAP